MDISKLSSRKLLELHAKIMDELCRQKIIRTANNPIGDLAESLFCTAFPDWKQERNSRAGYDAISPTPDKSKYQIKGRRIIGPRIVEGRRVIPNSFRQLGALRGLKERRFDILAAVLFNEDTVLKERSSSRER